MAAEKRLIDANGRHTINAVDLTGFILCFNDGIISVVDRFGHVACEFYADDIPTVDAVEVVPGRWEPHYETFDSDPDLGIFGGNCQTGWQCSVCGRYEPDKEPYCNCGAKMDGDGNG